MTNSIKVSEVNLMINAAEAEDKVKIFNEKVTIEITENISNDATNEKKKEEEIVVENGKEKTIQSSLDISHTTQIDGNKTINFGESIETTSSVNIHQVNGDTVTESVGNEEKEDIENKSSYDESNNISQYFSAEESFTVTEEVLGCTEETEWKFAKQLTADSETVSNLTGDTSGSTPPATGGPVVTPDLIKACNGADCDTSQEVRHSEFSAKYSKFG